MTCMLTRWRLSTALDRGAGPSRRSAGHLARCPACAAYADRLAALDRRLALGAPSAAAPPPAVAPLPAWRATLGPRLAIGGLALAAAAALALYLVGAGGRPPADPATAPTATAADPGGQGLPAPADRRERPVTRVLVERASIAFGAPPLRGELAALASDGARGARAVLHAGGLDGLLSRSR
jgi:hypothetical protein